jgi:hypothetical protein
MDATGQTDRVVVQLAPTDLGGFSSRRDDKPAATMMAMDKEFICLGQR